MIVERYHCGACGVRPLANLTLVKGVLWRPECLYALARLPDVLLSAPDKKAVLAQSRAAPHGLVVVDGGKPSKRRSPRPR